MNAVKMEDGLTTTKTTATSREVTIIINQADPGEDETTCEVIACQPILALSACDQTQ